MHTPKCKLPKEFLATPMQLRYIDANTLMQTYAHLHVHTYTHTQQ